MHFPHIILFCMFIKATLSDECPQLRENDKPTKYNDEFCYYVRPCDALTFEKPFGPCKDDVHFPVPLTAEELQFLAKYANHTNVSSFLVGQANSSDIGIVRIDGMIGRRLTDYYHNADSKAVPSSGDVQYFWAISDDFQGLPSDKLGDSTCIGRKVIQPQCEYYIPGTTKPCEWINTGNTSTCAHNVIPKITKQATNTAWCNAVCSPEKQVVGCTTDECKKRKKICICWNAPIESLLHDFKMVCIMGGGMFYTGVSIAIGTYIYYTCLAPPEERWFFSPTQP